MLRRRCLARLRKEAEPVPPAVLGRFLPAWHGIGSGRSRRPSAGAVLETIERLAGAPVPASALETLVLPGRVPGYSPALLDELTAAGEVVWAGAGTVGSGDGWLVLAPAESAPLLLPEPGELTMTPLHGALLTALAGGGGMFFRMLSDRVAAVLDGHPADDGDLVAAIWDLAWAGLVTNDTLAPLRVVTAGGTPGPARLPRPGGPPGPASRPTSAAAAPAAGRPTAGLAAGYGPAAARPGVPGSAGRGAAAGSRRLQPAARAGRGGGFAGGYRVVRPLRARHPAGGDAHADRAAHRVGPLVAAARAVRAAGRRTARLPRAAYPAARPSGPDPGAATMRAHALALTLLERHGVVTKGAVAAERIPGGFAAVYPVLRAMEETGQCRRGYFVEGLGGAQFALPGAVDRMRALAGDAVAATAAGIASPVRRTAALRHAGASPAGRARTRAPGAGARSPGGRSCSPRPTRRSPTARRCRGRPGPRRPRPSHRPGRKAGAVVVLFAGELVLYVERGGKTLLSWTEDPAALEPCAQALAGAVRDGALGRITVEKADGGMVAYDSPLTRALESAGFRHTPRGLRLRG